MQKTKLDAKAKKFADAFFEPENCCENTTLSCINSAEVLELEKENASKGDHKLFINRMKQVFLFLPGTFLLFFVSFGAAIIFMEIVVYRRAFETQLDDFPLQFALIGLIALAGTLMTWFGLGI